MPRLSKELLFLILIVLVGGVMRFYNFADFSLTNDELSALFRTYYSSFDELIEKGVIVTDPHPAGVQIFLYYWVAWFGDSAFWIRLPFVIVGTISVVFLYLIAKSWFGKYNGLFAASLFAVLEFPLLFSQIARPYCFGLFISLVMVFFWTKLVFAEKKKWIYAFSYAISAALCCLTHYFCGLFAVSVGLTGLFFLNKNNGLAYLLANAGVVLLFVPHISITLHHLEVGGLSGWLPPPTSDFFGKYILFFFNDSWWLMAVCALIILFFSFRSTQKKIYSKFQWIALIWFLFPMVVGYFYSTHFSTVLMNRVLLFTSPYLLLFLFSFIRIEKFNIEKKTAVFIVLIAGSMSTIYGKKYYKTAHFEDFRIMAENVKEWEEKYGTDKITKTINLNSPKYINYYLDRLDYETTFRQYININNEDVNELKQIVEESETPYFIAGWACIYNPYEISELIKRKYPREIEKIDVFNTQLTLYAKDDSYKRNRIMHSFNDMESMSEGWSVDTSFLVTTVDSWSIPHSNDDSSGYSFKMTSDVEYGPTLRREVGTLRDKGINVINFSAWCYSQEKINANLVISIERNGESLAWYASAVSDFVTKNGEWQEVFMSKELPKEVLPTDQIVAYIWNNGKSNFYIDQMEVSAFEDSYYNYFEN